MWVAVPVLAALALAPEAPSRAEALLVAGRCVACHDPGPARARLPLHPAADLGRVGARVRPDWLRAFLAEGHAPDLLADLPTAERARATLDLAHFLASLGGPLAEDGPPSALRDVEAGRQLYHSVGCVACHDPFDLPEDLELPIWNFTGGWIGDDDPIDHTALSLAYLPQKTTRAALRSFLLDPVAARPDGRMPSLGLSEDEAAHLADYLLATDVLDGEAAFEFEPGLFFREVHGQLDDELATYERPAARTGLVADVAELPEHPEDGFGFLFEGFVDVPSDGTWTFATTSDDGSRLYLDGRLLVDNGGLHGATRREATATLRAGKHALVVTFFEGGGAEVLSVAWSGPGVPEQTIPAAALFHLVPAVPPRPAAALAVEPARVASGRALYGRLGCAACHPMDGVAGTAARESGAESAPGHGVAESAPGHGVAESAPGHGVAESAPGHGVAESAPGHGVAESAPGNLTGSAREAARPLGELDPGAPDACFAARPGPGRPHYAWSEDERAAVRDLLARLDALGPPSPADVLERELARLDCRACHRRGGEGGPTAERIPYFQARTDVDLGDEGRLPPHLDGVGAKLREEWLARVLAEGSSVRPYLATRMPRFGRDNVAGLAELFRLVDADPSAAAPPFEASAVEAGRRLASVGNLGCIQCHGLGLHPSLGIPAVNLTTARERIEPAWFRKLLLDPRSVGMNSRMPIFWQDGRSPVRDVLDGDPARQTDALWSWLSLGEAMPLPDGLLVPDEEYELVPRGRPIECAVFLKGVSPRSVLVGFPERVHYAFDVQGSRPALAWHGRFYNARGTWEGRAGGLEVPPSDDVLALAPGVPVALLAGPDDPWPSGPADALGYRVLGRRLDAAGVPTFRYSVGDVEVEDCARPRVVDADVRLARTVRLAGPSLAGLALRVAVGDEVEALAGDTWRVDRARYALSLPPGSEARVRAAGARRELVVDLPSASEAELEVELSW